MSGEIQSAENAAAIFDRLSRHFDKLAGQVFDIEEQLGSTVGKDIVTPATLSKLQSIDYVRQSLEDCALLLHCLSQVTEKQDLSEQTMHNVSKKLKLQTTREVVLPDRGDRHRATASLTGHIDLF